MSLALDLFDRRFGAFMAIGRARLRSLAPEWTDHNAHDPGITLMELLAWVAEAQLYSVSRLRRDERASYAAMLGIVPSGTQGAQGLIWPARGGANTLAAAYAKSIIIGDDAPVQLDGMESPTFRPQHSLLWVPGHITAVETRAQDGSVTDHTIVNARGGKTFLPFGAGTGKRERLRIAFSCNDDAGLWNKSVQRSSSAVWSIGFMAAPPAGGGTGVSDDAAGARSSLRATWVSDDDHVALPIVLDTTRGLLSTGVLLLDVSKAPSAPNFSIELGAPNGFARPPRLLRVDTNVVPVLQGRAIEREIYPATGLPDASFVLAVPGLRYGAGKPPVTVEVAENAGVATWKQVDTLADCGPDDNVFVFDAGEARVTFGNGVNGRVPPEGAQVLASYAVSDAEEGDVARNRAWHVAGLAGVYGTNPDAVAGGARSAGFTSQRREARRRTREDHALVNAADIEAAARALPLLEVVRTWVVTPTIAAPRTGVTRLVAMRSRPAGTEPGAAPETAGWLDAVRRALAPRIPMGTRLAVTAPHYVPFSIVATLESTPGRDPVEVKDAVGRTLRDRLALVDRGGAMEPRVPGAPVASRDVAAWMRSVDGVGRITSVQLLDAAGRDAKLIRVPRTGLPRWSEDGSVLTVRRPAAGSAR